MRVFQHFLRCRSGHAKPMRRSVGTRPRSETTRTRRQRKENAIRVDSRLFAVIIRGEISHASTLMSYMKPKYNQKSKTVISGSLEDFPTPTRKPSVCLAKGVRFQRPPRPFGQSASPKGMGALIDRGRTTWKQIGSSANRISPPRDAPRRSRVPAPRNQKKSAIPPPLSPFL